MHIETYKHLPYSWVDTLLEDVADAKHVHISFLQKRSRYYKINLLLLLAIAMGLEVYNLA